jgi:hypothetical protein
MSNETRGRYGMYLKLGNRYAELVCTSALWGMEGGKEALTIETL